MLFDALGPDLGDVVHPSGAHRTEPQAPERPSLITATFSAFCFFFPDT
ncbi:hypothetical protein ABT009_37410 [Streptomyces sp. NPDC002896]